MCISVLTKSLNAAFFTSGYDKAFSNIFMKLWNKNMKYDFPQRRLWVMEEIQSSHLSHLRVRVCVFARLLWNISKDCYISSGFNRWVHRWRDDIRKRLSLSHACCRSVRLCVRAHVCVNVSFTDGRSLKEIRLASLPYDGHGQNIPIPWRNEQLR